MRVILNKQKMVFKIFFCIKKIKDNFLIIFKIKNIIYQAAKNAPV